jgi:hypothetical protein
MCILQTGLGIAQPTTTTTGGSFNNGFIIGRTLINEEVSVENSPYLYISWKPAVIELSSGNEIEKSTKVLLDVVNDKVFVEMDNLKVFEISPNDLNKIKITHDSSPQEFVSEAISEVELKKETGRRIYEIIFEHSEMIILKKNSKSFASKVSQNTYSGQGSKINDYIEKTTYYLKFKSEPFRVFKLNRKSITSLFPKKEKWIKSFIKEQKLDLKSNKDLSILLEQLLN